MSDHPIADHAMLSDCNTVALVDRTGSVEWWCVPDFDDAWVFGRMLDPDGGHFSIRPRDVAETERAYVGDSLVLATRFETDGGVGELTEGLAMADGARGHDLGRESPHVLLRRFRCRSGRIELDVVFRPRSERGLSHPLLRAVDGGVVARGGPVLLRLSSPVDLEIDEDEAVARGRVVLREGESAAFAVEYAPSWGVPPDVWTAADVERRLDDTVEAWRSWKERHQAYEGPYGELVMHSGRVLQGLTFRPTGAMVAAPTTSLPESVGGGRNWDYRYAWVRDAAFTLQALWVAACPDEAEQFFRYLTTAASSIHHRTDLQIVFGIRGERDLTERELPWLRGWRGSRPVRIGNEAWRQPQLDVYGEILSAAHRLRDQLGGLGEPERRFLATLADRALERWEEPDHGIWEMRAGPDHFVYSKLMCWVALDRAIDLADGLGAADRVDAWADGRERIREAILERGWSDEVGSFTQAFGSAALDASNLVIPIVGFLPPDDERVRSTIDAVRVGLTDGRGLLRRYRTPDGLDGEEGSFLLCTFWLAEALALTGRVTDAREVFERAASHANDVGLLSEEVDPATGELLGNFPQAFSHVGLVHAAWAITEAERRR